MIQESRGLIQRGHWKPYYANCLLEQWEVDLWWSPFQNCVFFVCRCVISQPTSLALKRHPRRHWLPLSSTVNPTHRHTHNTALQLRPALPGVHLSWCFSMCGNRTGSPFLLADSSSCCTSGCCPVPRPSCPGVRSSLRNSGKPRVPVGRL